MTIAVATGYSIARSEKARNAWQTRRAHRGQAPAQTPAEFRATAARLARMFPGHVREH